MEYNFKEIEQRWQQYWKDNAIYRVKNGGNKPKCYVLDMFAYPSGAGLHVGHPLGYIATDIYSRYKRLKGFNVLHPMGFDAFGLPAEQYAIQTGMHPEQSTYDNIARYRQQLNAIGFDYDWDREVVTCDPKFYKWTQWIFIQLFNSWFNKAIGKARPIKELVTHFETSGNKDIDAATDLENTFSAKDWKAMEEDAQQSILMHYRLAYQSYADVNWCPELGTVLANDEVKDGLSERGGYPVIRKPMRQWFLRITAYADRLLYGLDTIDWPESLKEQQRNWIGRSEGASIFFEVVNHDVKLEIFTTRPETIFGATFMVLAPEHELVDILTTPGQRKTIEEYKQYTQSRSDRERQAEVKKVTGAFTGAYAMNPFTQQQIPVWVGEYVLMGYGTGAIMAVPADDDRDHAFAAHFKLPVIDVIDKSNYPGSTRNDKEGKMINAGFLTGIEVPDAIKTMCSEVEKLGIGKAKVNYRMRDAGFSRQRYWGEPFPIIYKNDIPYTLPESELPVTLPDVESFKPTGTGESPLATATEWVNHREGKRETDTMPGYAGSSWYFLRYMDPHNDHAFAAKEAIGYWKDVDLYVGGSEHAVGHLLYSRFWHKFLLDLGYVTTDEPFKKLVNQGMIQGVSQKIYQLSDFTGAKVKDLMSSIEKNLLELTGRKFTGFFLSEGFVEKYELIEYCRLLNVPIDLVDNGKLDIRKYFELPVNQEFRDAIVFVCEDGSLYYKENMDNGLFYSVSEVEKMSKSKYNVVSPDDVIDKYGADAFRMYEMFLGPIEQSKPWMTNGLDGVAKFLRKLWRSFYTENGQLKLSEEAPTASALKVLHKTIKKIEEDTEKLAFNTCVSAFMICVNELNELGCNNKTILQDLVILIAPFAPHIAEELWQNALGHTSTVNDAFFPVWKQEYLVENTFVYPVSINGKHRANIELPLDLTQEQVNKEVLSMEQIKKWLDGKEPKRFIYVPGRIVNIVV